MGHFVVVLSTWLNDPGVCISSENKSLEKIVNDHMSTPDWTWDGHHSREKILSSGKELVATLRSEPSKKAAQTRIEWNLDFELVDRGGGCVVS